MGIYIWGTGCGAGEILEKGVRPEQITAFVDNAPVFRQFMGRPVIRPEQLPLENVELILISCRQSMEVRKQCLNMGIRPESMYFLKNHYVLEDLNKSCDTVRKLLGDDFLSAVSEYCHIIREPSYAFDALQSENAPENDYVRCRTLQLLSELLPDIPGAVAELGVYRGDFARELSRLFPDRTLYLFDSFQGFVPKEAALEKKAKNCGDGFLTAHKNTAPEQVLSRLSHPEKAVIIKGYFPESLGSLEDTFALVSLDADFEDTTYAGLSYFWPRLHSGGYLLLHDYRSHNLAGVKKALQRYEYHLGIRLPKVPLCDIGGTLVLCRP